MDTGERSQLPSQYYRGFNFLLDGEEQDAVDAFTEALAVNEETLDTHIALGSVLRKRGEVDRAIKIHQNLLMRPQLSPVQLHQSHLELARDFIAAGLYDRAEKLLVDLAGQSTDFSVTAQRHLLDVYEAQRDWGAAVTIAEQLIALAAEADQPATGQGQPAEQLRGQYLCELAEAALEKDDFETSRRLYDDALRDQPADLRACMGLAHLNLSSGDPEAAFEAFQLIMGSDRTCTPEMLKLLGEICIAHSDETLYLNSLERYYAIQQSPLLALTLAAELERVRGAEVSEAFLRGTLDEQPSVAVAASLLLKGLEAGSSLPERQVFDQLTAAEEGYQCSHCGFTGKARHWRCPGCRHWDSIHYRGGALEHGHG